MNVFFDFMILTWDNPLTSSLFYLPYYSNNVLIKCQPLSLEEVSLNFIFSSIFMCYFCSLYFFYHLLVFDEMGNRIDDLEKSISELMSQAGIEQDTS